MLLLRLLALILAIFSPGYAAGSEDLFPANGLKSTLLCPNPEKTVPLAYRPNIGDFVVYSYRQTYTFVRLVRFDGGQALEELGISKSKFSRQRLTWKEWQARDFPGALYHFRISWPLSEAQFHWSSPQIVKLSPSGKKAHLPPLLQALWTLPFSSLDTPIDGREKKLRVDPPSTPTTLTIDGQRMRLGAICAFSAKWPKDRSYLSEKSILLHFATPSAQTSAARLPIYWPVYLQIGKGFEREVLRAVEFGVGDPKSNQSAAFDAREVPSASERSAEVP